MDAPAVAVTRDGEMIAMAWMDLRSGRNDRQIYSMPLPGMASEKPLADDPKGIKGHPSISFDEQSVLHAAWEDSRSGVLRVRYRALQPAWEDFHLGDRRIRNRVWNPEGKDVGLSPEQGKASFPSLACGKTVGVAYEWGGHVAFAAP
jgi:hypothetical protein